MLNMKSVLFLAITTAGYFLLPLLIRDTGSAMLILLAVLPLLCLACSFLAGLFGRFKWMYPVAAAVLFVPTLFIFYNPSAWVYVVVFGVIALAGNALGGLVGRLAKL